VDNILISLDTSQDVEDLFKDSTKAAQKEVRSEETHKEDEQVVEKFGKEDEIRKDAERTEEGSSHEEEKHDNEPAASTEHTTPKVKQTFLASALSINVDDMDAEELMQLSRAAFTKAKERSAMKTEKRVRVITRAADRISKLLPSPITFQGNDDADNLEKALDSFNSIFSLLEKAAADKVQREFMQKKLEEICKTIEWDKKVLVDTAKEIKDCIIKGKALYSKCIHSFSFVKDIIDIIHKEEENLRKMAANCHNSKQSIIDFDKVVSTSMDKIRVLEVEKNRVLNRFSELRSLLTPKISILEKAKEDIEKLRQSSSGPAPTTM
jgi:hypothetical protein